MPDPKSLTIVTPTFHPELIGTPHYATDAAQWFVEQGWRVRVITAQPFYPEFRRHPGYGRRTRHDRLGEIEILRLPTIVPKGGRYAWRAVNEANFAVQGLLRARRHRSDAVLTITPGTPWNCWVARAARQPGARHVVLVHDVQHGLAAALGIPAGAAKVIGAIERRALQTADSIAVLTQEMGDTLRELGVTKPIEVVPIWATVPPPTDEMLASSEKTVQYSGNFGNKQGVDALVEVAKALRDGAPDVRLILRGSGEKFDQVRKQIADAGLTNVDFEAPVPVEDLPRELARSPIHIAVQAPGTAAYAMPSKVINALASGCHVLVLSEARTALDRLAKEVDGLEVFGPNGLPALATRAAEILADPQLPASRHRVASAAATRFARTDKVDDLRTTLVGTP